ncbi:MAG: MBL fold metallo-hydrolase [Gemmatimonadota bacterium]
MRNAQAERESMLNVEQLPVGLYQANAYLVWQDAPGAAVLVDAGAEAPRLLAALAERGLRLEAILQTHAHADHIAALPAVVAATGAPVYLPPDAEPMLHSAEANLSAFAGTPITAPVHYVPVADGDRLTLLGRPVDVLHTPGHAPGSVCFHFAADGLLFTGDTLFAGSIGRTDFPGGSLGVLLAGLYAKVLPLPDATAVHAGHLESTTIGRERATNPFLQQPPP